MSMFISESLYCLISTVHHFATPDRQKTLMRDPKTSSSLYNLSLSYQTSDDSWRRNFHCSGYPADTFALDFVDRHPWFSLALQSMLILMFVCFVALGIALAYEYGPWEHNRNGGTHTRQKREYEEYMMKIKAKHEES